MEPRDLLIDSDKLLECLDYRIEKLHEMGGSPEVIRELEKVKSLVKSLRVKKK